MAKELKLKGLSALRMIFRPKKSSLIYQLLVLSFICGLLWQSYSTKFYYKDILAQVGDRQIGWQMLWCSYHLNPKWGKGITHLQAFENKLSFLIDQKLFAQAARAEGLAQEPGGANYLHSLKEKEMINELYRQEAAARIGPIDQEYQIANFLFEDKFFRKKIGATDSFRAVYPIRIDTLLMQSKIGHPAQTVAEYPSSFLIVS